VAGRGIKELLREVRSLTARRDELADAIEDEPGMPEPAMLDLIRDAIAVVVASGDTAGRDPPGGPVGAGLQGPRAWPASPG
jgi:hypothetical protein